MNIHSSMIAKSFNKAASTYRDYAAVQNAAGHALIQQITKHRQQFAHVIDAGCGNGSTTRTLSQTIVTQTLTAVDIAAELLKQAETSSHIRFLNDDYNNIYSLPQRFDLIFSNMALHWSSDFKNTLDVFHQSLTEHGILAFSIPLHGTFSEIENQFSIQSFLSNSAVTTLLNRAGFRIIHHNTTTYREIFPDAMTALRSIKLTGANHVDHRRPSHLRGKSFIQSLAFNQLSYVTGLYLAVKHHE